MRERKQYWIEPDVRDTKLSEVLSFDPKKEYGDVWDKQFIHVTTLAPDERVFCRDEVVNLLIESGYFTKDNSESAASVLFSEAKDETT